MPILILTLPFLFPFPFPFLFLFLLPHSLLKNQEKIAQEVTQRTAGYLIADIIRVFQDSLKISFFEKEGGEGGERGEKVEGRHIFEALGRSRASILMGEEGVRGGKGEDGEKEKGEEGEKEGLFVIDLAAVTYIRQEVVFLFLFLSSFISSFLLTFFP